MRFGHLAFVAAALTTNGPLASAADLPFCKELARFASVVRAGQVDPLPLTGADFCQSSTAIGGAVSWHCAWSFPYRAADAGYAVADLETRITTCLDAVRFDEETPPVNHPDTFAQATYRAGGIEVSLSLKDKAASGRTLMFLGLAPLTQP